MAPKYINGLYREKEFLKKELALREIEDLFPLLFPFDRTSLCHPQRVSGIFLFLFYLELIKNSYPFPLSLFV